MIVSQIKNALKKFWSYLKSDSWHSWLVSLVLLYLGIRLIFFPLISLMTGSPLPMVIVESCSMYHGSDFDAWWAANSDWYEQKGITQEEFSSFKYQNGLNKGDIILVIKKAEYVQGDTIIYKPNPEALSKNPVIHRVVSTAPLATKGDNNYAQLTQLNNPYKIDETSIPQEKVLGKAVVRVPLLGWAKLIFFEPFRTESERGFCQESGISKLSH